MTAGVALLLLAVFVADPFAQGRKAPA